MLTAEQNERLTRVGPATPMGRLLRHYWHPIAAQAELDDIPVKAVRMMGEDLVLFRDGSGNQGLIQRRCPHRGFDLSYGISQPEGLRCMYHGWRFDAQGRCLERPFEDQRCASNPVRSRHYPVRTLSGLIWAYLGPEPAPLLPNWEPFGWENGFRHVFFSEIPCNWFQCQENSIDPVHFEWLHLNWLRHLHAPEEPPAARHQKLCFEEFDYGFRYGRLVEGQSEQDEAWTIGRVCLWPNGLYTGLNFSWRVPIDDERTLAVDWVFAPVPLERVPFHQPRIPYSWVPIQDEQGNWVVSDVVHQDLTALVAQGTIADRTCEHLGASDEGIILLRKRFFQQLEALDQGQPLKGLIHDPEENRSVVLPMMGRDYLLAHRPRPQSGYDAQQRSAVQRHVISGLSAECVQSWTEVFGAPPT